MASNAREWASQRAQGSSGGAAYQWASTRAKELGYNDEFFKKREEEEKREKEQKRVKSYKEGFFKSVNFEDREKILKGLKGRAEKGDVLAMQRYNAIVGDERLEQDTSPKPQLSGFDRAVLGAPEAVAQPFKRAASGTARALGAGKETTSQRAADANLEASQQAILRVLRDPNVPQSRKDLLTSVLDEQNRESVRRATEQTRQVEEETDPKKFIGATAEVASLPFGGGGVGAAFKAGGRAAAARAAGQTVGAGMVGGGGVGLQQDDATVGDVALGAGVGGLLGLGADLAGMGLGVAYRRTLGRIKDPSRMLPANATITDPERLLPAQGTSGAKVLDESRQLSYKTGQGAKVITDRDRLLSAGQTDPSLAVVGKGADIADVKKLQAVERRIKTAQRTGNITAEKARALMRERNELVQRIQNPTTELSKGLREVDRAMDASQKSGNQAQLVALGNDRLFLEEEAIRAATTRESAELLRPYAQTTGKTRISRAAQRTEIEALDKKLTEGFEGVSTYEAVDTAAEASRVVDFMNADYQAAKRVAMGEIPAPDGTRAGSFFEAVKARALREGDVETLERLATESALTKRASRFGQEIQAFAYKDPESPVTAIKAVQDSRKKSKLPIPRNIAPEESKKIVALAKEVADTKAALANGGDRLAYGRARVAYDKYVNELVAAANKKSLTEALKSPGELVVGVAGVSKSLRASLDNSVLLRQGWKTLFTHPGTWAKNSAKSFKDWVRAAGGREVMEEVASDIVSRDNSLNGLYKRMKLDVFGTKEEAFPTSVPERIPLLGRAFRGSEAAYTAWQQRTRADLADKYLEIAQRSGVDLTSDKELKAIGKLVNSLTGRGDLGRTGERASKVLNNVFFSPRLLKSNIDMLTGHQFQRGVTPFVRKRAARNLVQVALGSAAVIKLASEVAGAKVEYDPRSSDFGKIKIGDTRFDLSGGMSSIATFGARLASKSYKSSTTGEVKSLDSGDFGSRTGENVVVDFFANKFSPAAGVLRDYFRGETFDGEKLSPTTVVRDLTLPLTIVNFFELKDHPRSAAILPSMLAEILGVSTNTYGLDSDWNNNNSKRVTAFKEKAGSQEFSDANKKFNEQFMSWYDKVSSSQDFWGLSQEERLSLVTSKKNALTDEILKEYGFTYKQSKKDNSTKKLIDELKRF